MRSRASLSASQGFRRRRPSSAASISAAVTRMPSLARSEPVEFGGQFDQRLVAARLHVGEDGAHGLFDIRRGLALDGEETRETGSSKSGALLSRRMGMTAFRTFWPPAGLAAPNSRSMARGHGAVNFDPENGLILVDLGMDRAFHRRPDRAEIGQFGLQAFDLEPHRRATRENQIDHAGRAVGFGEFDGQQVENGVLAGRIDAAAFAGQHAFEAQGGGRRRYSGLSDWALSQSKRLSATTTRLSFGRHRTSATLTTASCRWADTTSRSSSSRTANFNWSRVWLIAVSAAVRKT